MPGSRRIHEPRARPFLLGGVCLELDAAHRELVRSAEHGGVVAWVGHEVSAGAGEYGAVSGDRDRCEITEDRPQGAALDRNRGRDERRRAELHLVQPASETGLDDRGRRERRAVDDRSGPVAGRHRAAHGVVAKLGDDPDLRAHVPGLQGELNVLQVLGDHAHDGARGRDAGRFEGLREAAVRCHHGRRPA